MMFSCRGTYDSCVKSRVDIPSEMIFGYRATSLTEIEDTPSMEPALSWRGSLRAHLGLTKRFLPGSVLNWLKSEL